MAEDHAPPVIDPTANVIALVKEHERYNEMRFRYSERFAELRAKHYHELRNAEAARLDAIRAVDREDVKNLATATNRTAETLRALVETTAHTLQGQTSAFTEQVNKRLLGLELAMQGSASKGEGGKQMWGWIVGGIGVAVVVAKFLMEK